MSSRCPAILLVLATLLAGCGPSDPRQEILDQRARWNVIPLDWVVGDDGAIRLSTRVTGPVHSKIEQLSFRVVLLDAQGQSRDVWRTIDVSTIRRGGPKDVMFRIEAGPGPVEQLQLDPVADPTPDEEVHIAELGALRES